MVPPVSTITGYSVLVAFHVIFVVTMLGVSFLFPVIGIRSRANPMHLPFTLGLVEFEQRGIRDVPGHESGEGRGREERRRRRWTALAGISRRRQEDAHDRSVAEFLRCHDRVPDGNQAVLIRTLPRCVQRTAS